MYHGMRASDRAAFERQLRRLRAYADLVSLSDALAVLADPQAGVRCVALTFDDGRQDALDHAVPILAARGIPAAFFVVPQWIGTGRPGTFGWHECRSLAAAGFEVGSHSLTHARLAALPDDQAWHEVSASRARIEAELGRECRHFACPWGQPDEDYRPGRDPGLARRAEYRSFLTTVGRQARPGADPFQLPRVRMEPHWGAAEIRYAVRR